MTIVARYLADRGLGSLQNNLVRIGKKKGKAKEQTEKNRKGL